LQFSKLLEDIERIKAGPAPILDHTVVDEVENAPGWVRVSRPEYLTTKISNAPSHYYWHPATGQLSWTSPEGQDASKSLEMTRTIVTDAVERLQKEAESIEGHIPPPARKAIQASALLHLLHSIAKEQQKGGSGRSLEHIGSHASKVWCTVHACIAAAVAEIGTAAPVVPVMAAEKQKEGRVKELIDGRKAITAAATAVVKGKEKSDDDMDIESEEEDTKNLEPPGGLPKISRKNSVGSAAAGNLQVLPFLGGATTKTTSKKTKVKSSKIVVKGATAMMNKWATVQKELKEEDDASDEEDEVKGERKRLRQAEEWRTEQIRSGAVDGNSNFAPVMGDWRDKIKRRSATPMSEEEKEEEKAVEKNGNGSGGGGGEINKEISIQKEAEAAAVTAPDVDALSVGLPYGWRAIYDAASGGVYYGNIETQATQWERPTG
jgi:hypothetical protein